MTQSPIAQNPKLSATRSEPPVLETFYGKGAEGEALRRECEEIIARKYGSSSPSSTKPVKPARTPRKTTLASALKQAAKVGKSVRGAEVYPDRVVLQFGEPTSINANPWDEVLINATDQKRPS